MNISKGVRWVLGRSIGFFISYSLLVSVIHYFREGSLASMDWPYTIISGITIGIAWSYYMYKKINPVR